MNRRMRMKNLLKDIVMNFLLKDLFFVFISKVLWEIVSLSQKPFNRQKQNNESKIVRIYIQIEAL